MTPHDTVKAFLEADAKRTQGEWFWSSRTLRSHIDSEDSPENKDILGIDADRCIYGAEADCDFITLSSTLAPAMRELLADVAAAREALAFYSDPDQYCRERRGPSGQNWIEVEIGVEGMAIEALARLEKWRG